MSALKELLSIVVCRPLLTRKDIARRYGRSFSTIERWVRKGILPKPFYLRGCPFPFWKPETVIAHEKNNLKLQKNALRNQLQTGTGSKKVTGSN